MPEDAKPGREASERLDFEIRDIVDKHLHRLHRSGGRVLELLDCSVGRILRRDMRRAGTVSIPIRPDMLAHIRDWLVAADRNDAFWLSRADADGRPLKLMKLGSIEACNAEADKAMRLEAARVLPMDFGPEDEAFEWDAGGGFAFVRLLSERALDLESSRMGHCIGNGAYDDRLARSDHAFLSLRGPNGAPHATLELADGKEGWTVRQAQGKGNGRIAAPHRGRILSFLADYGIPSTPGLREGFWTGPDGIRPARDVCALPSGSFVAGSADFDGEDAFVLPEDLRIEGDLVVRGPGLASLPGGLKVGGDLRLTDCPNLRSLPEDLEVSGAFFVDRCEVPEISVPSGATIVVIDGRGLETPPALVLLRGIEAHRIRIWGAVEVRVGDDVSAGEMSIGSCRDVRFGSRVRVSSGISFGDLPRLDLPGDMIVPGQVHVSRIGGDVLVGEGWSSGGLDLQHCGRVVLPDGLKVGKDLTLCATSVDRLPEGLDVGGDLRLAGVAGPIRLPDRMTVGGSIRIEDTAISSFPDAAKIAGDLHLVRTALARLPSGVVVAGDLVADVGLGAVPEGARIRGRVVRVGCRTEGPVSGTYKQVAHRVVGAPERLALGPDHMLVIGRMRPEDVMMQQLGRVHRSRTGRSSRKDAGGVVASAMAVLRFRGAAENSRRFEGSVTDADGRIHAVDEIPEGVVVAGDLDFGGIATGPRLPRNAFVTGSMRLIGVGADELPDGLRIGGDLVVDAAGRRGGPTNLVLEGRVRVDGNLILKSVRIVDSAPGGGIDVGGSARLDSCRTEKGPLGSVSVGGRLDVSRSPDLAVAEGVVALGGVRRSRILPTRILHASIDGICGFLDRRLGRLETDLEKRKKTKSEKAGVGIVQLREAVAGARRRPPT